MLFSSSSEPTTMFSEYFREELLGQLVRATARGAKNILINSS